MKDSHRIGHHHHLTPDDVAVSMFHLSIFLYEHVPGTWQYLHGILDKSCDAYLDELKEGYMWCFCLTFNSVKSTSTEQV
jgi:hypothetical protein